MRMVRRVFWIAVFVGTLVLGWRFAAANGSGVAIDYLWGITPELNLWAVLLASFGAGAACAALAAFLRVTQLRLVARRYRKAVRQLESEVHQLRNLPLSADAPLHDAADMPALDPPERALERGT